MKTYKLLRKSMKRIDKKKKQQSMRNYSIYKSRMRELFNDQSMLKNN